jgi:hypothetical protein
MAASDADGKAHDLSVVSMTSPAAGPGSGIARPGNHAPSSEGAAGQIAGSFGGSAKGR